VDAYNSATRQQSKNIPSTALASSQLRNYLHFGSFYLDVEALLILVENPGQIITRETLRARLWPNETEINYDANVNTTVNKLRHILGDSHDRPLYVETIPRRGYTFIANAQCVEQSPFVSRQNSALAAGLSEGLTSPTVETFFGAFETSRWFRAGAISIFVGAVLFGAALVLFVHRGY